MSPIKIFISYSEIDKQIAGLLKDYFYHHYGFEVFIAHSDISCGSEWEKTIITNIKCCDFFIPMISTSFKQSNFTDQETGMAIAFNRKIIPVKLDNVNPYGFIYGLQALSCKGQSQEGALKLVNTIFGLVVTENGFSKYRKKAIDSLIVVFSKSKNQSTTKMLTRTLLNTARFSKTQARKISLAIKNNTHIDREQYAVPSLKKMLNDKYGYDIDSYAQQL